MSVNKFWSIGKNDSLKSDVSKTYVDQKFTTLSNNLKTKASKFGETFSGDIIMGENKITSRCIPSQDYDLINKKYLDEVASKKMNDNDYKIIMNNLSLKINKGGGHMTGPLELGVNKVTSSYVPKLDYDLVNKKYVDNKKYVKNSVGLIPDLTHNTNSKCGFKPSASSDFKGTHAYYAFSLYKGYWQGQMIGDNNWIKIELPEGKRIYKFSLRCISNNRITDWALLGSYDGNIWMPVYSGTAVPLTNTTQYFDVNECAPYFYYKLDIKRCESSNPALNYFQLFALDEIVHDIGHDPR